MNINYLIYIIEAVAVTVILGYFAIPLARKYKARQSIREEGPRSHRAKAGTPTMGGLFMILAAVIVILWNHLLDTPVLWLLFLTIGHGVLGFLDDFIKAEKKRNLGLTAKQKLLGQLILSVLFCWGCIETLHLPLSVSIPFLHTELFIGSFYYIFVILVLIGGSNAVNLTDGLDGLASGCCVVAFFAYGVYCYLHGLHNLGYFITILAGACIGFLFFNYHLQNFYGRHRILGLGRRYCRDFSNNKNGTVTSVFGDYFCVRGTFGYHSSGFF